MKFEVEAIGKFSSKGFPLLKYRIAGGEWFKTNSFMTLNFLNTKEVIKAIDKVLGSVDEQNGPRYPQELMNCLKKELGL